MPGSKMDSKNKKRSNDDDSSDSEVEEEQIISKKEYQKFLNSIFPSKYMADKVKKNESKNGKSSSKKSKNKKAKIVKNKKSTKKGKKRREDSSSESESDSDDDLDEEEGGQKIDLVFTIVPVGGEDDEEYDEEDETSDDEEEDEDDTSEEEDEDDDTSDDDEEDEDDDDEDDSSYQPSDDEDDDEEEEEEEEDEEEEEEDEEENKVVRKSRVKSKKNKKSKKNTSEKSLDEDEDEDEEEDDTVYKSIKEFSKTLSSKYKNNSEVAKQFKQFEKKIMKNKKKIEKKDKRKNTKQYLEKVSSKNLSGDISFFKNSLNITQQRKLLKELDEVNKFTSIDKPYRIKLLETEHIPNKFKAIALKKINAMKISGGGGEFNKLKTWVDSFLQIPFGKISTLPVSRDDPKEKIYEFMDKSQEILDNAVYGMTDAKTQLMQMVAQWIANPQSVGNAIALKGPMGTGKTTLIKYGVSKLLNREFAFIPLGGATDSSYLEGHSYTYEGSVYGKIVDILIQCKTSNPVIYFDELDKVSDTPKGEEIIGILTHLTDTTQNDKFHDKYFSEIDFDLSKCLFIFSYNDESKINPILKDRMYNIETMGYDYKDKIVISRKYLIPKIECELKMEPGSLTFEDETLKYIVEKHTNEEKGVRNLKRCFEIIYSKVNLYNYMKPDSKLFDEDIIQNIEFPYNVSNEIVDKLIKTKKKDQNISAMNMYL